MDRPRRDTFVLGGAVVLLGIVAFWSSLHGAFVFDDVSRSSTIRRSGGSATSLPGPRDPVPPNRVVAYLSFALNYRFGGLAVEGFHLVNLIVHLVNALLVFGLVRLFLPDPSPHRVLARRQRTGGRLRSGCALRHPPRPDPGGDLRRPEDHLARDPLLPGRDAALPLRAADPGRHLAAAGPVRCSPWPRPCSPCARRRSPSPFRSRSSSSSGRSSGARRRGNGSASPRSARSPWSSP